MSSWPITSSSPARVRREPGREVSAQDAHHQARELDRKRQVEAQRVDLLLVLLRGLVSLPCHRVAGQQVETDEHQRTAEERAHRDQERAAGEAPEQAAAAAQGTSSGSITRQAKSTFGEG